MNITRRQGIAIAVIVALGLAAGSALLIADRHDEAHGEHAQETHTEQAQAEKAPGHDPHSEVREIKLTPTQQQAAGIAMASAGPGRLQAASSFPGEVRFDEDRTAHIVPRTAGVAQAVPAQLGQRVDKGALLAVIASTALSEQRSEWLTAQRRQQLARSTFEREKKLWQDKISAEQDYLEAQAALEEADIAVRNASQKLAAIGAGSSSSGLNRLELRAPFAGTIVEKHLSLGEAVKEDTSIFTLTDLSRVTVEFTVAPQDLARVRVGQQAVVASSAFESKAEGRVAYVGALLGEQTRSAKARVHLENPEGAWRPGLFTTVSVLAPDQPIALAVGREALQTVDNQPTLFVATPQGFSARAVKLGRSDSTTVEILDGLQAGEKYASANTFVLKSELGKASAGHGH